MSDDPLTVCETCGKPVAKVMHSPAVHFKGKGFYNTDYGTRNRQRETAAAAAESSSSKDGSSKDSSSKDTSSAGGDSSSKSASADGKGTGEKSGKDSGKGKETKPAAGKKD